VFFFQLSYADLALSDAFAPKEGPVAYTLLPLDENWFENLLPEKFKTLVQRINQRPKIASWIEKRPKTFL